MRRLRWVTEVALDNLGKVWAWGTNTSGELGLGKTSNLELPSQVPNLRNIVDIAAGSGFSLALDKDGNVWAWGNNSKGQLGLGDKTDRLSPTKVKRLDRVSGIAAGSFHSLFRKD